MAVSSQVIQAGAPPLAIDYKLHLKGGAWKIHDVSVDGVSLMTNYRSDFAAKIRQGGIDGLVQRLNEMNRKVSGAG